MIRPQHDPLLRRPQVPRALRPLHVRWLRARTRLRWLAWRGLSRLGLRRPPPLYRAMWESVTIWQRQLPPGAAASVHVVEVFPRQRVTVAEARPIPIPGRAPPPIPPYPELEYQAVYAVGAPHARVYHDAGDLIVDGHLLLPVSMGTTSRLQAENQDRYLLDPERLPPPVRLGGSAMLISARWGATNYFHWLFEVLPRLEVLRRAGITWRDVDRVLVNGGRFPFLLETLLRCGVPPTRATWCEALSHYEVDYVWTTTSMRLLGHRVPWVSEFLRRTMLDNVPDRPRRRLYISRADAATRRVANEAECVAYLQAHGFECVTLTGRKVADQARLFAEAEIVVAPHGASLTNAVFCRPGTVVIEIFPPNFTNRLTYRAIANAAGAEYYYMGGERVVGPVVVLGPHRLYDFTVPVDWLRLALRTVGAE